MTITDGVARNLNERNDMDRLQQYLEDFENRINEKEFRLAMRREVNNNSANSPFSEKQIEILIEQARRYAFMYGYECKDVEFRCALLDYNFSAGIAIKALLKRDYAATSIMFIAKRYETVLQSYERSVFMKCWMLWRCLENYFKELIRRFEWLKPTH